MEQRRSPRGTGLAIPLALVVALIVAWGSGDWSEFGTMLLGFWILSTFVCRRVLRSQQMPS